MVKRGGAVKFCIWCIHGNKNVFRIGALMASVFDIIKQRILHFVGQGEGQRISCFLLLIMDRSRFPVNIRKFQPDHVSGPHTQVSQETDHAVGTFAGRCFRVNAGKHLPDFFF